MELIITKTYLYHWLCIFSSSEHNCIILMSSKLNLILVVLWVKQHGLFPLRRAVLCVTKGSQVGGKCTTTESLFSFSAIRKHELHHVPLNRLLIWHHDYIHKVITFCLSNTIDSMRIVILNLVYLCQIAWK